MAPRFASHLLAGLGALSRLGALAESCVGGSCARGLVGEESADVQSGVHLLQTHAGGKRQKRQSSDGIPPMDCWDREEEFNFDQEGVWFMMHIPKTAACSLKQDLLPLAGSGKIFSKEFCYSYRENHNFHGVITMLRNPRSHVLSQFTMCDTGGDIHVRLILSPHRFDVWVRNWAERMETGPIEGVDFYLNDPDMCYRPVSLQTHRYTCHGAYTYPNYYNVTQAIDNMMQTDYVGIIEAYQESICLFQAKMTGALPSYCDCTDPASWNSYKPTELDHESKPHNIEDYNEAVLADLDRITTADRELYRAGVERFRREIREVEEQFGTKIMCNDLVKDPALQYVLAPLAD